MEELEADAAIAAVLGHRPSEIVRAFQDPAFASQPPPSGGAPGAAWDQVVALCQTNHCLWKSEDEAHSAGIGDAALARLKRQIDSLNQQRNELIEAIDQKFRERLRAASNYGAPPLHDSPGLILDRLSIETLRAKVLFENAAGAGGADRERGLQAIEQEIGALVERLREIMAALISGRRALRQAPRVKIHRTSHQSGSRS
jgi:hypothetical protein